ncbi:MAG TPA: PilT/PilU family type 4a pilus ATPase [Blastocatellia bacterium]|nr:PilT/PilU family type 4a pilus ATPase [Blastocatellia bacterium]
MSDNAGQKPVQGPTTGQLTVTQQARMTDGNSLKATAQPAPDPATESFNRVLKAMLSVSDKVSDLIFSPGKPPQIELNNKLRGVNIPGLEMLTPEHTEAIAGVIIKSNRIAIESLQERGSADISYAVPGHSRFRVNVFRQRGTTAIVMRNIPMTIPGFEQLNLPPQLKQICELKNGIVLVTGPTGSGKSSTLAAVIDLINETRYDHIVTIEDPIEFLHRHKNCTIHQRELHADTPNFALALRAALRQAPKVILVGEMRDVETIETAMEAAETGHLVMSTLHTIDAAKTVDRIVGVFPKNEEAVIRTRLAQSFRFIISQRLLPRADGNGRIAAMEILKSTARTKDYIEKGEREGKSLIDAMKDGEHEGMQSFDQVLERYTRQGLITINDALAYASNRGNLQLSMQDFISASQSGQPKAPAPAAPGPAQPAQSNNGSMLNMIDRL